jgi:Zn-dependent protease
MNQIKLFRVAGIQVYLSWWWFLLAIYEVQARRGSYSSTAWNVAEYVALFAIVLTHEFGHALATRQVGGTADRIMLWPLGGVAYVNPPQRPGATLWAIAAGPLVNVALAPLLYMAAVVTRPTGWPQATTDLHSFFASVFWIDVGLFVFNILPVYPLDGGQILRSLLWFVMGRGKSLMTATVIGFFGVAGFIALAVYWQDWWLGLIAFYAGSNCWSSFKVAQRMLKLEKLPRRMGLTCPSCRTAPPIGPFWKCSSCGQNFDTFESGARCPHCGTAYPVTTCLDCRRSSPPQEWTAGDWVGMGR